MLSTIIFIICALNVLRVLYHNRATLKKLSARHWANVLTLYLATIGGLFVIIYYGVNWIRHYFSNQYVQIGIFVVLVIMVFSLIEKPFKRLRDKATGGLVK